jgi:predicted nucleic acid-binding protein
MIAADTSTWVAFLAGHSGNDSDILRQALQDRQLLMPPIVLTELLSDPAIPSQVANELAEVPLIEVGVGYWERSGALRAKVLAKGRKARLGDALIAQSCLDEGVILLTRDRDFRSFTEASNLTVVFD